MEGVGGRARAVGRERIRKEVSWGRGRGEGEGSSGAKFWSIDPTFNRINKGRKRNFVDEHLIRLKMPDYLGNMFILLFLCPLINRFARGTEAALSREIEIVTLIVSGFCTLNLNSFCFNRFRKRKITKRNVWSSRNYVYSAMLPLRPVNSHLQKKHHPRNVGIVVSIGSFFVRRRANKSPPPLPSPRFVSTEIRRIGDFDHEDFSSPVFLFRTYSFRVIKRKKFARVTI